MAVWQYEEDRERVSTGIERVMGVLLNIRKEPTKKRLFIAIEEMEELAFDMNEYINSCEEKECAIMDEKDSLKQTLAELVKVVDSRLDKFEGKQNDRELIKFLLGYVDNAKTALEEYDDDLKVFDDVRFIRG